MDLRHYDVIQRGSDSLVHDNQGSRDSRLGVGIGAARSGSRLQCHSAAELLPGAAERAGRIVLYRWSGPLDDAVENLFADLDTGSCDDCAAYDGRPLEFLVRWFDSDEQGRALSAVQLSANRRHSDGLHASEPEGRSTAGRDFGSHEQSGTDCARRASDLAGLSVPAALFR